jgi:hypothetical protein
MHLPKLLKAENENQISLLDRERQSRKNDEETKLSLHHKLLVNINLIYSGHKYPSKNHTQYHFFQVIFFPLGNGIAIR